jgi:Cd2+/Zn2+-exporting ATPase
MEQVTTLRLTGLDCADCAAKLEQRLRAADGVESAAVNFGAAKVTVRHQLPAAGVIALIEQAGYGARLESAAQPPAGAVRESFLKTNQRLLATVVSGLFLAAGWAGGGFGMPKVWTIALYLAAALVGGWWTFRRGFSSLRVLVFDMNVLMTIAVTGAVLIGEWSEAATVAVLYSVSNLLESYTLEKTRQSIRSLMQLTPPEALVRRDGDEVQVAVGELEVGDLVIVRPGERIPVDGRVAVGSSAVNQAPITGESLPVEKAAGSEVFAGTINQQGALEVRVTRLAGDTTLARIIHLVEEAQGQKAPSQALVDRFARYYTPVAMAAAALVGVVPPLAFGQPWGPWVYRALALLVVACPCALVISTPVAIVSAIGNAAKHGVLIKGGVHLEQAGSLAAVAFDKTGTLTRGRPEVTDVLPLDGTDRRTLLGLAAAVENRSEHPLAQAIVRAARNQLIRLPEAQGFAAVPGKGARAEVGGRTVFVGNRRFLEEQGVATEGAAAKVAELEGAGKTAMLLGSGVEVLGLLALADEVRHESARVVEELHGLGVRHVVMLTGDNAMTAQAIADRLGVDEFRAQLLPEEKLRAVRELQERYGAVAMVGDGINDAPALATATVGVAMGAAGTDTALETADIALMSDDLTKVPYTIRLSRKALGIIRQNIGFALVVKAAALALILPNWLTLWLAVLADMGASLLVTLNGLRLLGRLTGE